MNARGSRDLFRVRDKLPLPYFLLAFIVRVVIGSRITLQRSAEGLAGYQCQPRRLLKDYIAGNKRSQSWDAGESGCFSADG